MRSQSWILLGFVASVLLPACALGEDAGNITTWKETGDAEADDAEAPGDAGKDGDSSKGGASGAAGSGGYSEAGDVSQGDGETDGEADDASDEGAGGKGGSGGAGGSGGTAGSSGTGGTGGTGGSGIPCTSTTTCNNASSFGEISGDKGADSVQVSGSTEAWVKVRIAETDESLWGGRKLKVRLTLTSPANYNFDMDVYVNADSDVLECSQRFDFSMKPLGQPDSVSLEWGEGSVPNGSDDDRWVAVNIKHGSDLQTSCSGTAKWTLKAEGNQ